MVIMGAGGHAKEVLEALVMNQLDEKIAVFDNITPENKWQFPAKHIQRLRNDEELAAWFESNSLFIVGVGGIHARNTLWNYALDQGGKPYTLLASNASICQMETIIGEGTSVMQLAFVSASVSLGKNTLINTRANIHHDVKIGDYSEIAPSAVLLGNCQIGSDTFIGANATILPKIKIGTNCTIGAGAVVTRNVPDNTIVKGNPAK